MILLDQGKAVLLLGGLLLPLPFLEVQAGLFEGFLGRYHAGLVLRIALPVHLSQGIQLRLLQLNGFLQVGGGVLLQAVQFILPGLESLVHLGLLKVPVHLLQLCIMNLLQEFQLLIQFILVLYLGLRIVYGNLILLRGEFLLLIEPFLGAFRKQGEFQGEHFLLGIQPGAGGIRLLLQPFLRFAGGFLPGGSDFLRIPAHGILIVGVCLDHLGVGIGFGLHILRAGLREGIPAFDKFVLILRGFPGPVRNIGFLCAGFLQELDALLGGVLLLIGGLRPEFRNIPFRFGIPHSGIPGLLGDSDFFLCQGLPLLHLVIHQADFIQEVHELRCQPAQALRHLLQDGRYSVPNARESTEGGGSPFNSFLAGFQRIYNLCEDIRQEPQDCNHGSG